MTKKLRVDVRRCARLCLGIWILAGSVYGGRFIQRGEHPDYDAQLPVLSFANLSVSSVITSELQRAFPQDDFFISGNLVGYFDPRNPAKAVVWTPLPIEPPISEQLAVSNLSFPAQTTGGGCFAGCFTTPPDSSNAGNSGGSNSTPNTGGTGNPGSGSGGTFGATGGAGNTVTPRPSGPGTPGSNLPSGGLAPGGGSGSGSGAADANIPEPSPSTFVAGGLVLFLAVRLRYAGCGRRRTSVVNHK